MLKEKHDCNLGITWDTIDDHLGSIVPETDFDDGFVWQAVSFEGIEYQCRYIKALDDKDFELLVAPIALLSALRMDVNGNGTGEAVLLDEWITFYATSDEMVLGDKELFDLIYSLNHCPNHKIANKTSAVNI